MPKTIVVGDIHGCYYTLLDLIDRVGLDTSRDKIIFLGDYIDRGLYSKQVVKYLRELQEKMTNKRCVCIRGNHEQMAIEAGTDPDLWGANGGYSTLWSYRDDMDTLASDVQWMLDLPFAANDGKRIYCHAGLTFPMLDDCVLLDLLWDRNWLKANPLLPRELPVVFGHTPSEGDIIHLSNSDTCIDGGCVFGYNLCALTIYEDGRISEWKVPKHPNDSNKEDHEAMLAWYYNTPS